ncbi:MAG TPA: SDR family oxidoreductase, partial [Pseudomonadales bacterium]|nr:SDR family oxidoreductase [Pseudomonadales bacterium]
KTVFITGCSTGIGRATAKLFQRQKWNVVATMRSPEKETELTKLDNVLVTRLDVNDADSIQSSIQQGIEKFGRIDVMVNNAGYALMGAFETLNDEQIQRQFDTNVFGLMRVCRAILPHFRQRNGGTLINVASMAGRLPIPLMSVYNASKWAVEGFTECLTYELSEFNVAVKIIEPGAVNTDFFGRSSDRDNTTGESAYQNYSDSQFPVLNQTGPGGSTSEDVAQVIYTAANDDSKRLRYQIGVDAKTLLTARKMLPDQVFLPMIGWSLKPGIFKRFGRIFYKPA